MSINLYNFQKTAVNALNKIELAELTNRAVLKNFGESENLQPKNLLFWAPTGAGKTVMIEQNIIDLNNGGDQNTFTTKNGTPIELSPSVFIILNPNSLDRQFLKSFQNHGAAEHGLNLLSGADIQNVKQFQPGDVAILNWASINSEKNRIRQDGDTTVGLASLITDAKNRGLSVIVYIDEAHRNTSTQLSKNVLNILQPELIINVTATPTGEMKQYQSVRVLHDDVVSENVIVQQLVLNQDVDRYEEELKQRPDYEQISVNMKHVYYSIRKMEELNERYKKVGSPVISIAGVQLPVSKTSVDITNRDLTKDSKEDQEQLQKVLKFLKDMFGWTVENGDIAILLANDKRNFTDGIKKFNSKVKVLIFKYALAVGYDLPRMKTLAMLHNTKTKSFAIQVTGRVLRQPERKSYSDPWLNRAYCYTQYELVAELIRNNSDEITTEKTVISLRTDFPKETLQKLRSFNSLPNWRRQNNHTTFMKRSDIRKSILSIFAEHHIISPESVNNFRNVSKTLPKNFSNISEILVKLGFSDTQSNGVLVSSATISDIDNQDTVQKGDLFNISEDIATLRNEFLHTGQKIIAHLGYEPVGANTIETAFSQLFHSFGKGTWNDAIRIFVADENAGQLENLFVNIVNRMPEMKDVAKSSLVRTEEDWTVPERIEIKKRNNDGVYCLRHSDNFLYTDGVQDGRGVFSTADLDSKAEKDFVEDVLPTIFQKLSKTGNTKVGAFKSGTQNINWLAIPVPYAETEADLDPDATLFYPDFFIFYADKNGDIHLLLIETKKQKDANGLDKRIVWKADALDDYLAVLRKHGITNVSGAVINLDKFNQEKPLQIDLMGTNHNGETLAGFLSKISESSEK